MVYLISPLFFYLISAFCLWLLLSAILINFVLSKKSVVKEKKSVVETGSMLAFFIAMVLLVILKLGRLKPDPEVIFYLSAFGTLLIIIGTAVNIAGRLRLKGNWGNQIRIYKEHTLVTTGVYKYIRHPLYSSTILMIYGFSLLCVNYAVFILNTIIFIPFMIHRAKMEDEMLYQTFKEEYTSYKEKTGLFLPKLKKR